MTSLLGVWWLPVLAAPVIGSFVGLLAMRLPEGRPVLVGRSQCDHCGHLLGPLDLVPLASWIALRRRCRHCGARLASFYPLVELGAVGVALTAALVFEGWLLWASCALGWALLALALADLRAGVLPDALTLPLVPAGLAVAYAVDPATVPLNAAAALVGFLLLVLLRWGYRRLRGREGLGLGDAKLLAAAGAWASLAGLPSVLLLGSLATLLWVLVERLRGRSVALATALPFGPGLCLGTWIVWLWGTLG